MKLLVIQPWFSAIGHPAQSLLSFASAVGRNGLIEYLVSWDGDNKSWGDSLSRLEAYGEVTTFSVSSAVGAGNTLKALFAACRRYPQRRFDRLFFFDGSILMLAVWWPFFAWMMPIERITLLHLFAPSFGRQAKLKHWIIGRFLKRTEVRLYLRTEELANAWREAFQNVGGSSIRHLPSLEIADDLPATRPHIFSGAPKFGIIGQIRVGKAIEWLVPAFSSEESLGTLTVAGEFNSPETRMRLSMLNGFPGLINRYLSEDEMLDLAAQQDYLLMLYDNWDRRMESAVLYLAARVNRPVIVYGDSWCGRKVREYGCGVVAPESREETMALLRVLPRPGTSEYASLLEGMESFREAHSTRALRGRVVAELLE